MEYVTGPAAGNIEAALSALQNAPEPADPEGTLARTQGADGSWRVATRARGFQTYFESGFPHGKDQFISIAGSAWATSAA